MGEVYLARRPRARRSEALRRTGRFRCCARLSDTNETIWSKYHGDVGSPSVPSGPDPDEADMRVCMEQTGQTRAECDAGINRQNAG